MAIRNLIPKFRTPRTNRILLLGDLSLNLIVEARMWVSWVVFEIFLCPTTPPLTPLKPRQTPTSLAPPLAPIPMETHGTLKITT